MSLIPFGDSLRPAAAGMPRATSQAAFVRVTAGNSDEDELFEVTALSLVDADAPEKGHVAPQWSTPDNEVPCVSPFWWAMQCTSSSVHASELRVCVSKFQGTTAVQYNENYKGAFTVPGLRKAARAVKLTLFVPVITNMHDVEAGSPLFLEE